MLQQNYLMNFGYLPQSDLETGNLRTDDQLREAIRSLQVSFHHNSFLCSTTFKLSFVYIYKLVKLEVLLCLKSFKTNFYYKKILLKTTIYLS